MGTEADLVKQSCSAEAEAAECIVSVKTQMLATL